MKNPISRILGGSLSLLLLIACGDGGGGKSDSGSSNSAAKSSISLSTPGGTPCTSSFGDSDAFGNIRFQSSTGTTPWGCLVVDQASSQPTVSGTKAVRIEVRPGDCDSSQTFMSGSAVVSDCTSDRSRYEIRQVSGGSTAGQIITYEYYVYIPAQANFHPPSSNTVSAPLTVLTQINWQCGASACPSIGSNGYGALAYLLINSSGTLFVQSHQDFTWAQTLKSPLTVAPLISGLKSSSSLSLQVQVMAFFRPMLTTNSSLMKRA